MTDNLAEKNKRLVRNLILVAVAMFGFGYALVPLYNWVCVDLLGLRDRADLAPSSSNNRAVGKETVYEIQQNREVLVEFTTVLNAGAPMLFRAETQQMKVHPGQYYVVNFYAENTSDKILKAQAKPSISPVELTDFFEKTQCFCFVEQTFKPKESKTMPVRFVVKPNLSEQYNKITLLYTFFDITDKK